jgi:hypothetical protein
VFLVGKHFSVSQTSVIAGGQLVANTEMLSRQVIKAVIPAKPVLTVDGKDQFVDVYLATPYGVTSHLLIPAVAVKEEAGSAAEPAGVAWKPDTFEIAYTYGGLALVPDTGTEKYRPQTLLIQKGDIPTDRYPTVDLTLHFDQKFKAQPVPRISARFDKAKDGYVVEGKDLSDGVFSAFGSIFGPETNNPPETLVTTRTDLTFKSSNSAVPDLDRQTTNNLTIKWIKAAQAAAKTEKPSGP